MARPVGKRWKILLAIGLAVALVDQWTKFLAVAHLTPGLAQAHAGPERYLTPTEVQEIQAELSFTERVKLFYGSVKGPCRGANRALCPTVEVIPGLWNWRYVENPGAAWGLLSDASDSLRIPFFLVVPLAAIFFIIAFIRKLEEGQQLLLVSLSLVFGGAIGNFIDRLHLSYVIDFIDWYVGTAHWPTFNFADAAITTGVALLLLEWIRDSIRARGESAAKAPRSA